MNICNGIDENKIVLTWLNSINKLSNKQIIMLLDYFDKPIDIWDRLYNEKKNISFLKDEVMNELILVKGNFDKKLFKYIKQLELNIITIMDNEYPDKLRVINNPPCVLYCRGDIECLKYPSIAIVGSRKATDYGKWCANKFSRELSNMGITVVSGLAYGIDSIAHKAALETNGRTIGVIGNGIDITYPEKNRELYNKIENYGGLVLTEYAFGVPPIPRNFPLRNRIISGLSDGVLVIEAQNKSGTLITVSHAAEQGKDVFAIPGNINSIFSIGTNKLIRDGAKIVLDINDIIDEVNILKHMKTCDNKIVTNYNNLSEKEIEIVAIIRDNCEVDIDFLVYKLNYTINEMLSNLTLLEMKNIIMKNVNNKYTVVN